MKKILLLTFGILTAFTALCQTFKLENGKELIPVDVWSQMKQVNAATPQEIQVAAGIDYIFVLVEIPNNTAGKIIRIQDTKPPDPGTKPDVIVDIDNLPGPGVVYSPATNLGLNVFNPNGWYHFKSDPDAKPPITWPNPAHNQSFSVLNTTGYVEISWIGYKFEWLSEKRLNHGIAAVSVDGASPVDVDLYDPTTGNNSQVVYTWVDPAKVNKPHKVRISFTGRSNPATKESNIIHDAIKVYSKQ